MHRVLRVHEKDDGDVDLLTKGDNNKVDDRGLYTPGQKWLNKQHVIGRARGWAASPSPLPCSPLHRVSALLSAVRLVAGSGSGALLTDGGAVGLQLFCWCATIRYLPYVGMVTIIMNDYPMFKCEPGPSRLCPLLSPLSALRSPLCALCSPLSLETAQPVGACNRWLDGFPRAHGADRQRVDNLLHVECSCRRRTKADRRVTDGG